MKVELNIMNGIEDEGYLLICLGRSYIEDALDFAETLRHCGDFRPIDIVVENKDKEFSFSTWKNGKVIIFNPQDHELAPLCKTTFEEKCLLPRLNFNKFLLREKTIVVDTDVLCASSTDYLWKFLNNCEQPVIMTGSKLNLKWHWGHWGDICKRNEMKPIEAHGGFFFFRKKNEYDLACIKSFLEKAEDSFINYDELGFLRWYQNGAVDEPCFARAFSLMDWSPIEFSEFPIMTFNIDPEEKIPTKKQTADFQKKNMDSEIPFIHVFQKNKSLNFILLKEKILNTEF